MGHFPVPWQVFLIHWRHFWFEEVVWCPSFDSMASNYRCIVLLVGFLAFMVPTVGLDPMFSPFSSGVGDSSGSPFCFVFSSVLRCLCGFSVGLVSSNPSSIPLEDEFCVT